MSENRYHHLGWHHGMELYEAEFSEQVFSRHAHEGFAIGAIGEGVGGYVCRGESLTLPAGSLSLMNPDEPHTGHAAAGRVRYNMLYVPEEAVRQVLALRHLRGFAEIAQQDHGLRVSRPLDVLARLLNSAPDPNWQLAVEEAVHEVLANAFSRYARAQLRPAGSEPRAVAIVKARVSAGIEIGERLTLADLAADAGLHPSYLVRSFKRATGMTPHAYVVQRRASHARRLLLNGIPAAEAAFEAGFSDQAHLIRQFRRQYGVTPGALVRH